MIRRGACPSLWEPMQTGDGLLLRLKPIGGALSGAQMQDLAASADAFGNGHLEITSRGSLQIRGLTEASVIAFRSKFFEAGIDFWPGIAIEICSFAGIDDSEIVDPRPIAMKLSDAIASRGLSVRLSPKISVIVDGGGRSLLRDLKADVRLEASQGFWQLSLDGNAETASPLGKFPSDAEALAAAIDILDAIATMGVAARGADLRTTPARRTEKGADIVLPGSILHLSADCRALCLALPYGSIHASALLQLLSKLEGQTLRLAPQGRLFVLSDNEEVLITVRRSAAAAGFITDADDPRHLLSACAGAPACGSAFYATHDLADRLAREAPVLLTGGAHLSGCAKRCASPASSGVTVIGQAEGMELDGPDSSRIDALATWLRRQGHGPIHRRNP